MALPDRYRGRPILIAIENYALAVIGELDADKAAGIAAVVQRVWGGGHNWMLNIREQLAWAPSIDDTIRRNWKNYQRAARDQGVDPSAVEFAMMFADAVEQEARSE
jgi:hypothetical protein